MILGGGGALPLSEGPTNFSPNAVAVDGSGNIYAANFSPKQLIKFSPSGEILRIWDDYYVTVAGLAGTPDGVVIASYGGFSIDRVGNGELSTLFSAGRAVPGVEVFRPTGVAVARDGHIYAAAIEGGDALIVLDERDRPRLLESR